MSMPRLNMSMQDLKNKAEQHQLTPAEYVTCLVASVGTGGGAAVLLGSLFTPAAPVVLAAAAVAVGGNVISLGGVSYNWWQRKTAAEKAELIARVAPGDGR
jgi:uncharacterized membrane protein YphA (DoxX/SURF4 family)